MRALLVLALAPAIAFMLTRAIGEPEPPVRETEWQTSLVWADRVFVERAGFDAWLRARGRSYDQWSRLHPAAAARLEGTARPAEAAPAPARERESPSYAPSRTGAGELLLVLAAVLVAVAVPTALMRRVPALAARDGTARASVTDP